MKRNLTVLIGIFIIAVAALVVILLWPSNKAVAPTTNNNGSSQATTSTAAQNPGIPDLITEDSPAINAAVGSPITISGQARGTWYFEASFPVELLDANGKTITAAPAKAQGDWMTTDFVPFALSLPFAAQPAGSKGTLVLHKDNPSGDPARDQSVSIPVVFK